MRVVSTFGPDGIDMTDAWAALYERLGPAELADMLEQGARLLRERAKGGAAGQPNPEARMASAPSLHAVGHSAGLVVADQDTVDGVFSWRIGRRPVRHVGAARDPQPEVDRPVELVELGGWGWCGPVPPVDPRTARRACWHSTPCWSTP